MKMEMKDLAPVAIILVVAVIAITMGSTILEDIKETNYVSVGIVNETLTQPAAGGSISLGDAGRYVWDGSLAVSIVYNSTNQAVCHDCDYSVSTANFSINLVNSTQCNCSNAAGNGCNITYAYMGKTSASNTSESGQSAMITFGGWTPTIALILAAAIIIGIIVNSFRV